MVIKCACTVHTSFHEGFPHKIGLDLSEFWFKHFYVKILKIYTNCTMSKAVSLSLSEVSHVSDICGHIHFHCAFNYPFTISTDFHALSHQLYIFLKIITAWKNYETYYYHITEKFRGGFHSFLNLNTQK